MVADRNEDLDVIGIAEDELEAAVQVFFVRRGRVLGRKGLVLDKVMELEPGDVVTTVLEELYYDDPPLGFPKQVLVPTLPDDAPIYEEWLTEHRRAARSRSGCPSAATSAACRRRSCRTPARSSRGIGCVAASDHNSRARALNELQNWLELPEAPLRIECFDMSHIQGTDYVGSMVVMTDGLADKREYRRFKVKTGAAATTTSRRWRRC